MITLSSQNIKAQQQDRVKKLSIETEPISFILGGAGMTGSYQYKSWIYSIEAFGGLTVPESLHGNEGFGTSLKGIELQVERFLTGTEGFYIGPEIGISSLEVTYKQDDISKSKTGYSVGIRGGYHWNTGLGNLYATPVGGLSYSLNAEDIRIQGETFESGAVSPWATVGLGWSF